MTWMKSQGKETIKSVLLVSLAVKQITYAKDLKEHINKNHSDLDVSCERCDFVSKSSIEMRNHVKANHFT